MTGILHRLVSQANGRANGGLRPRLPSHFEAGMKQSGFTEIHSETPAEPAPRERRQTDVVAPHLASARAAPVNSPSPLQVPPSKKQSRDPSPEPRSQDTPHITVQPSITTPTAPAPLMPNSPVSRDEPSSPISNPVAPHFLAEVGPQAPPDRSVPRAAPERLLPPEKSAPLTDVVVAALNRQPSTSAPDATAEGSDAAQPEITIHIGRLDIRSQAPKAVTQPRRAAAPRGLPGLSDYLRGGRQS